MIDRIELGNLQGCVCKIAQHPTFICNCNSRLKKYQPFLDELKACACILTTTKSAQNEINLQGRIKRSHAWLVHRCSSNVHLKPATQTDDHAKN